MDGGGSKQYHVLSSAKHDIQSVQRRTDWIISVYPILYNKLYIIT